MKYAILDMKFADVVLPSFYEIDIMIVKNGSIINRLSYLVDPDTDYSEKMVDKYGIRNIANNNYPSIVVYWREIYHALNHMPVFIFKPSHKVDGLLLRANVDYLKTPNFKFIDVYSLSRKIWNLPTKQSNLENYSELLGIAPECRIEALDEIVKKAFKETGSRTPNELIEKTECDFGYCLNERMKHSKDLNEKERQFYEKQTVANNFDYVYVLDKCVL